MVIIQIWRQTKIKVEFTVARETRLVLNEEEKLRLEGSIEQDKTYV